MIPIEIIALILLLMRIGSGVFILIVMKKQWELLKVPIEPHLMRFRMVLFALSLAIFIGNIIPVIIDAATLFFDTTRPPFLSVTSVSYAMSNAITALLSAYFIHTLYRIAAKDDREKEV